jgi:hypothetical protein
MQNILSRNNDSKGFQKSRNSFRTKNQKNKKISFSTFHIQQQFNLRASAPGGLFHKTFYGRD